MEDFPRIVEKTVAETLNIDVAIVSNDGKTRQSQLGFVSVSFPTFQMCRTKLL